MWSSSIRPFNRSKFNWAAVGLTVFGLCTPFAHAGPSGTGDGGGGNIYNGKPLESYINPDVANLPGFKLVVQPVRDRLVVADPNLASVIDYWILTRKKWYVLPGPLTQLPPDKIASAVPTQQGVLQDFDQVWVDSNLFYAKEMTEMDKGRLLLHEVLMGIKILRLESRYNQCDSVNHNDVVALGVPDPCMGLPKVRLGQPKKDLTPQDYIDIRSAGEELIQLSTGAKASEILDIMARYHFGFQDIHFPALGEMNQISTADFSTSLRTSYLTQSWPNQSFSQNDLLQLYNADTGNLHGVWKSNGTCQFTNIDIGSDHVGFTLSYKRPNDSTSKTIKVLLPFAPADDACNNYGFFQDASQPTLGLTGNNLLGNAASSSLSLCQPILRQRHDGEFAIGDKSRVVSFYLNGSSLAAVEIGAEVIVEYSQTSMRADSDEGGHRFRSMTAGLIGA